MSVRIIISRVRQVSDVLIRKPVRRQKASAAHADIYIALQLQHYLLGNIVRHHPLRRTFRGESGQIPVFTVLTDVVLLQNIDQFRESRSDKHTLLILNALDPLV